MPIRALSFLLLFTLVPGTIRAAAPVHAWDRSISGPNGAETMRGVAMAMNGEVAICGSFLGTIDLGGDILQSVPNHEDLFVARYWPGGTHRWSQRFGADQYNEEATDVAFDAAGNVFMTGRFLGPADFGGGPVNGTGFLAKFDPNGTHIWSKGFAPEPPQCLPMALALDALGNVIITGYIKNVVNFGGANLDGGDAGDLFLAKFDGNGLHIWSQRFGGALEELGWAVTCDASSSILVGGHFNGTANFGGSNLVANGTQPDAFVAKYTTNGSHLWSKRYGSTALDRVTDIAVDGSGNPVLSGIYENAVDFGGGPVYFAGGGNDVFLLKLTPAGLYTWDYRVGSWGSEWYGGMAADASGNIVLTAVFWNPLYLGGPPLESNGWTDVFALGFSPAGDLQWSRSYGSTGVEISGHLAMTNAGNFVMTGSFSESVDFGGGPLTAEGTSDGFVARYGTFPTAVDETPIDRGPSLRAFPNPFNPSTSLEYVVPVRSQVRLEVYDVRGLHVATLVNAVHDAGTFATSWRGLDEAGRRVGSGIYFARLTAAGTTRTEKLLLLK